MYVGKINLEAGDTTAIVNGHGLLDLVLPLQVFQYMIQLLVGIMWEDCCLL